jgi:hypothetical protein
MDERGVGMFPRRGHTDGEFACAGYRSPPGLCTSLPGAQRHPRPRLVASRCSDHGVMREVILWLFVLKANGVLFALGECTYSSWRHQEAAVTERGAQLSALDAGGPSARR